VIGGTMTNLFIVRKGVLATPRLDRCGVAGVTRDRVVEAAARHDIFCDVTDLSWDDVLGAEELFLVNSLAGVWPVSSLEDGLRIPGPVTRAIQKWIDG
jgi:4-amino-4-deoxychorismate lyase